MKKEVILFLGSIIVLLSLMSCDREMPGGDCLSYTTAQVTEVVGPNSVLVNQEIDLMVFYYLANGCGRIESLDETTSGKTTSISLKASYRGCVCATVILDGQISYKFKASQTGVYYLRFLQPNQTYLTDTIIVN